VISEVFSNLNDSMILNQVSALFSTSLNKDLSRLVRDKYFTFSLVPFFQKIPNIFSEATGQVCDSASQIMIILSTLLGKIKARK